MRGGTAVGADERASDRRQPPRSERVGSFDSPTYVAAPRGDPRRLFVTERDGISGSSATGEAEHAVPDIRSLVSAAGEGGLLSMAFPPD